MTEHVKNSINIIEEEHRWAPCLHLELLQAPCQSALVMQNTRAGAVLLFTRTSPEKETQLGNEHRCGHKCPLERAKRGAIELSLSLSKREDAGNELVACG